MIVIRSKQFSLGGKIMAGTKTASKWGLGGAATGFIGGAALSKGRYGKKALVRPLIGAGIGFGVGSYLGFKEGVRKYNYENRSPEEKAKEREKIKKDLQVFVKQQLKAYPSEGIDVSKITTGFKTLGKENNIEFKEDWYKYIKMYDSFCRKYYKEWYTYLPELNNIYSPNNISFTYIFPCPDIETAEEEIKNSTDKHGNMYPIVITLPSDSDHSWLFYDPNRKIYSFECGFGHDSPKLKETLINFTKGWIEKDINKIEDPAERKLVETHNKIIDKFISMLRTL